MKTEYSRSVTFMSISLFMVIVHLEVLSSKEFKKITKESL
jgi:hypothetical protein